MKKYWNIYKIYFANSFSYFVQYRKDFWFNIFINFVWIGIMFLLIEVIFGQTQALGGWNKGEVYLLTIFWMIMDEFFVLFLGGNLFALPDLVTDGMMDFYLTKPANSLFLVSTKFILIRAFYRLLGELAILAYVIYYFSFSFAWHNLILGILLLLCGVIIQYSIVLMLNTLSFWFMRIDNINDAMGVVNFIGKYPLNIFSKTIKIIFLTALPIAFFAYIPTAVMLGHWPWYGIVYALIFAMVSFILAVKFWNFALKKYSSASS